VLSEQRHGPVERVEQLPATGVEGVGAHWSHSCPMAPNDNEFCRSWPNQTEVTLRAVTSYGRTPPTRLARPYRSGTDCWDLFLSSPVTNVRATRPQTTARGVALGTPARTAVCETYSFMSWTHPSMDRPSRIGRSV
jgi:hypothetical protein